MSSLGLKLVHVSDSLMVAKRTLGRCVNACKEPTERIDFPDRHMAVLLLSLANPFAHEIGSAGLSYQSPALV